MHTLSKSATLLAILPLISAIHLPFEIIKRQTCDEASAQTCLEAEQENFALCAEDDVVCICTSATMMANCFIDYCSSDLELADLPTELTDVLVLCDEAGFFDDVEGGSGTTDDPDPVEGIDEDTPTPISPVVTPDPEEEEPVEEDPVVTPEPVDEEPVDEEPVDEEPDTPPPRTTRPPAADPAPEDEEDNGPTGTAPAPRPRESDAAAGLRFESSFGGLVVGLLGVFAIL